MTGAAGLVVVTELVDRLDIVGTLDEWIGPIKQRDRGLSGAELLVGMATSQLAGESSLAGLGRSRADAAGARLAPVPFAPSRTAARLAERFGPSQLAGIETGLAGIAGQMMGFLPAQRRAELVTHRPTLDCDSTDVEVYGHAKHGPGPDVDQVENPLTISGSATGGCRSDSCACRVGDQDPGWVLEHRPRVVAVPAFDPGTARQKIHYGETVRSTRNGTPVTCETHEVGRYGSDVLVRPRHGLEGRARRASARA
ncbi:hypothetical protein [Frankia sp. Cas3]|uniref:hypothetical protein n=1 Tax=Frankia sp. Cas3 TaxID=3073926 RepID=UPI002AD3DE14|nr:hypothetical protein [Frankia sp. Cas3]